VLVTSKSLRRVLNELMAALPAEPSNLNCRTV
jgi:hypothetical protein